MTMSASAGRSRSTRASASRCRIQHSTVLSARTSAERTPPAKAASSCRKAHARGPASTGAGGRRPPAPARRSLRHAAGSRGGRRRRRAARSACPRRRCASPCRPAGTPGRWGRRRCTSGARQGCGSAAPRGSWRRARSASARTIRARRRAEAGRSRFARVAGRGHSRMTPASRRGAPASARCGGRASHRSDQCGEHARGGFVDVNDALEVEHREPQRVARDLDSRSTGSRVAKRRSPCSSKTATGGALLVEQPAFRRRATALGALGRQRVAGAHGGLRGARRLQEMQVEPRERSWQTAMPRTLLPRASSARRKDADAELARQHRDDAAGRRRSWPACRRCRSIRRRSRTCRRCPSR